MQGKDTPFKNPEFPSYDNTEDVEIGEAEAQDLVLSFKIWSQKQPKLTHDWLLEFFFL